MTRVPLGMNLVAIAPRPLLGMGSTRMKLQGREREERKAELVSFRLFLRGRREELTDEVER